jgi:hypothetical protein
VAADHDRHAAHELGEALLELLAIVAGRRLFDLLAQPGAAPPRSLLAPAPSMIVVLSLSITTRLALPRSFSVTFSSLRPSSSVTWPPVRIAMSWASPRRSPKPAP